MKECRECKQTVSEQAQSCPNCGAPYPAREHWDGWGFEYVSKTRIGSLPLVHVSFKYRPNYLPVPARGVIAVGQFAVGVIAISQFGIGLISVSQMTLAGWALCQIGAAGSLIAQIGVYVFAGKGQLVVSLHEALAWLLQS